MPFTIPAWAALAANLGAWEVTHSFSIWLAQGPGCPACPSFECAGLPAIPACLSCPGAPAPVSAGGAPQLPLLLLAGVAAIAALSGGLGGYLAGKASQPVVGHPVSYGGAPVKTVASAECEASALHLVQRRPRRSWTSLPSAMAIGDGGRMSE